MNYWKNSHILLEYYIRDAFHGLASSRWLKTKKVRAAVIVLFVGGYLLYLALNFLEANRLRNGVVEQSRELMEETFRGMVGPVVTVNAIYGVIVSLIVFLTFSLTPSSLYISKTMPFSRGEVSFAQRIIKLVFASLIFAALFAVEISALTIAPMDLHIFVAMVLLAYCTFIFFYISADLFLSITAIPRDRYGFVSLMVGAVTLALLVLYFFFVGRYSIDWWISHLPLSTNSLIAVFLLATFVLNVVALLISKMSIFDMRNRERLRYIKIPVTAKSNSFFLVASAFIREKLFIVLFSLDILVCVYSLARYGYSVSSSFLPLVMGAFSVAGIRYADTTFAVRRTLKIMRWNAVFEAISLVLIYTFFLLPTIFFTVISSSDATLVLQYYALFFAAVIIGFFFPKSVSNTNEAVSVVVLVVVLMALVLVAKIDFLLPVVVFVLWGGMLIVIKKETEEKTWNIT